MSNYPKLDATILSPNCSKPRNKEICKITPHHMAGNLSIEVCGNVFLPTSRQASSNYGIDSNGRSAMYVEEINRAWTSSSAANDNQAVTFEIANNSGGPNWTISEAAVNKFIEMCVDICRRNPGIKRKDGRSGLYYDGTPNASLTLHRMFSATGCFAPYGISLVDEICKRVNECIDGAAGPIDKTLIAAKTQATPARMFAYIQKLNPAVTQDLVQLYWEEGLAEGIRGDVAFAQSCLETGNFLFNSGTAVTFDQSNFCGMGVVQKGVKGNSYKSQRDGVRAQIQHLKAYANNAPLVNPLVAPTIGEARFKYVKRGCSPYVEWLGVQENPEGKGWATGAGYGAKILNILDKILKTEAPQTRNPAYDAVDKIVKVCGFNSPEYWYNQVETVKYFDTFVTRIAEEFIKVGK